MKAVVNTLEMMNEYNNCAGNVKTRKNIENWNDYEDEHGHEVHHFHHKKRGMKQKCEQNQTQPSRACSTRYVIIETIFLAKEI